MKRAWFAGVFLIIAGLLCSFEIISVEKYCGQYSRSLDEAKLAVSSGDYEKANLLSKKLKDDWINTEVKLNYFLEHSGLDELSVEITSLSDYTDDFSRNEYLSTADKIKRKLSSLYRSELPYGENIF